MLNIIYVFNSFPIVYTLNDRNPGFAHDTTITFMYKLAFKSAEHDVGMAAAAGVVNVLLILVAVAVYLRVVSWRKENGMTVPPARLASRRAAGPARQPRQWRNARRYVLPLAGLAVGAVFLAPYVGDAPRRAPPEQRRAADADHVPAAGLAVVHVRHCALRHAVPELAEDLGHRGVASTAIVLVVAVPAAYFTARFRFRGRTAFLLLVLVTQMFAPTSLVVGLYREFFELNLVNTYLAIILTNAAFNLAFAIWILQGFFSSIPERSRRRRTSTAAAGSARCGASCCR